MLRIFSHSAGRKEVEIRIEDTLIVNEYHDVFPEELLGSPPDREVECFIDLF